MAYYQLFGLGSHCHGWFNYSLQNQCEVIYTALSSSDDRKGDTGSKEVELVLGVSNSGSSYLLATEAQMGLILSYSGHLVGSRRLQRPYPAANYASLSPIIFYSISELFAKAKTYTQKSSKRAKGPLRDTSTANKIYDRENTARPGFEHQRVLWQAIQGSINFDKFSLPPMFWLASTTLVSLSLQAWEADKAHLLKTNPKVLDLGLAGVSCMAFRQNDYVDQIKNNAHIRIKEHSALGNRGVVNAVYRYGQTETVQRSALGKRLEDFFSAIESERAFLLVYDAEQTLNALKAIGVHTEAYRMGIRNLLCPELDSDTKPYETQVVRLQGRFFRYEDRRESARDPRSDRQRNINASHSGRSRSPARSSLTHRPISPPPRLSIAEAKEEGEAEDDEELARKTVVIHVIDIRALFLAHSRLDPHNLKSLVDMAIRLDIPVDRSARCAGNDCLLLIEAWKRMASGNAIDEQYREVWAFKQAVNDTRKEEPLDEPSRGGSSSDRAQTEDYDPNDVVVAPRGVNGPGSFAVLPGTLGPPMDDSDDEELLYDY